MSASGRDEEVPVKRVLVDEVPVEDNDLQRGCGALRAPAAHFSGVTRLDGATVHGDATFDAATFHRHARFVAATVHGLASFDGVTVHGNAWFDRATVHGDAWFEGVTVHGDARLVAATFHGLASFDGATLHGDASLPVEVPTDATVVEPALASSTESGSKEPTLLVEEVEQDPGWDVPDGPAVHG